MSDAWYDADDDLRAELLAQDRWERRRHAQLMRNPDCRDPDHPGCERCDDEE